MTPGWGSRTGDGATESLGVTFWISQQPFPIACSLNGRRTLPIRGGRAWLASSFYCFRGSQFFLVPFRRAVDDAGARHTVFDVAFATVGVKTELGDGCSRGA